jgi:rhodanese-related sulfurtransferase
MADDLRISAADVKRRISAGEEFTIVDTRNPHAWAEANDKAAGALRVPVDEADVKAPGLPREKPVVAYCT